MLGGAALLLGACSGVAGGGPEAGDDGEAPAARAPVVADVPPGFRGLVEDEWLRLAAADAEAGWSLRVPALVPEDTRLSGLEQVDLGRSGTGVTMSWTARRSDYELDFQVMQIAPDVDRPDTSAPPPQGAGGGDEPVVEQEIVRWAVGDVALSTTAEGGREPRHAQASWGEDGAHFTSVVLSHVERSDLGDRPGEVPAVDLEGLRLLVESFAPLD